MDCSSDVGDGAAGGGAEINGDASGNGTAGFRDGGDEGGARYDGAGGARAGDCITEETGDNGGENGG